MNQYTANRISEYLRNAIRGSTGYNVQRIRQSRPFEDFHQWANGKALISADLIERGPNDALILLLIDWREENEWYLIACAATNRAPLAEVWQAEALGEIENLVWRYRPSKRDGHNAERLEYFKRHVGDLTLRISVPDPVDRGSRFLDDVFDLVDNRVRADILDLHEPETRASFPEGQEFERLHRARERSAALIRLVKNLAGERAQLVCQICEFDFLATYGELGRGYIEAHHTVPVSELEPGSETRPEDIALVCSNCHRMLHRRRPWLRMHELRQILGASVAV